MSTENELKRCPFCGCEVFFSEWSPNRVNHPDQWSKTKRCILASLTFDKDVWNTRSDTVSVLEGVRKSVKELYDEYKAGFENTYPIREVLTILDKAIQNEKVKK